MQGCRIKPEYAEFGVQRHEAVSMRQTGLMRFVHTELRPRMGWHHNTEALRSGRNKKESGSSAKFFEI